MRLVYYPDADAIYIHLRDLPYHHGVDLDTERHVDYAENGTPIGVALLDVEHGIDTTELPQRVAIDRLLQRKNFSGVLSA